MEIVNQLVFEYILLDQMILILFLKLVLYYVVNIVLFI